MKFFGVLFLFFSCSVVAQELTVIPLTLPANHSASLTSSDFQFEDRLADVFEISLNEFTEIEINAASEKFDTALYLLDKQTGELHYNDDKSGLNAGIDLSLNPGNYWVGVTSASSNIEGSYTLSIESPSPQVYFIVDADALNEMGAEVQRLVEDVSADINALGTVIPAPEDPVAIRDLLRKAWIEDNLVGAFLIGDVAPINEKVSDGFNDNSILSDHYYRALDCPYEFDADEATVVGKVNFQNISRCNSTIWLSRIYPSKSGEAGMAQVRSYLDKNHLRRRDKTLYKPEMMFQPSTPREDRRNYEEFLSPIFSSHPLYTLDDVKIEQNDNATIQRARFDEAIEDNYEILNLNIHGSSQIIQFQSLGVSELIDVNAADLADLDVNAKILEFTSCNVGEFTQSDYFAGEALFGEGSLLISAYAALIEVRLADFITARMNTRYRALGYGLTYADAYRFTSIGTLEHLFGDPTIGLRESSSGDVDKPALALEGQRFEKPFKFDLNMGTAKHNETTRRAVTLRNSGSEALVIEAVSGNTRNYGYAAESPMTNGADRAIETSDFIFQIDLTNSTAAEASEYALTIPPGESAEIAFLFTPSLNSAEPFNALFTGLHRFRTNDPNVPLFHINITGSHGISANPLPSAHGTSSDGRVTTSVFGGGATHSSWDSLATIVDANTPVDIGGVLVPEEKHTGRIGNLYLFAEVEGDGWYAMNSQGDGVFLGKGAAISADRNLAHKQALELTSSHEIELIKDSILAGSNLVGKHIGIVMAYSIEGEDVLFFNEKPFEFSVQ